jgi:hypothetical protein
LGAYIILCSARISRTARTSKNVNITRDVRRLFFYYYFVRLRLRCAAVCDLNKNKPFWHDNFGGEKFSRNTISAKRHRHQHRPCYYHNIAKTILLRQTIVSRDVFENNISNTTTSVLYYRREKSLTTVSVMKLVGEGGETVFANNRRINEIYIYIIRIVYKSKTVFGLLLLILYIQYCV